MRITKEWLREARLRITSLVEEIFKLDEDRLRAYVGGLYPGMKLEGEPKEFLLLAVKDTIYKGIPDHMVN